MADVDSPCKCAPWPQVISWEEKLLSAAKEGHTKCVQHLITDERYKENREFKLKFATWDLAKEGDVSTLEFILKTASEVNVEITHMHDGAGMGHTTTIEIATIAGQLEIVVLLLRYGASVDAGEHTPLHHAVNQGLYRIAETLLEAGANCNVETDLNIPLIIAVRNRSLEGVKLLIRYGADVDRDSEGFNSALHYLYNKKRFFRPKHNDDKFLILKELVFAADVRKNYVFSTAICFARNEKCNDITVRHLPLLYAAGFTGPAPFMDGIDKLDKVVPQFIRDDLEPMLSLLGCCRKKIRAHLLSAYGGNQKNLLHAVPKLPIPQLLKDFLLFGVELYSVED